MKRTIVIKSDRFGRGDDELGVRLMNSFLRTLLALEAKPDRIVFYNGGVKLLAEGSPVLDVLDELNRAGVLLVACGTCVSHFKLDEKVRSERISNMREIATILMESENVVTV
ncbi:sulfurtransferase-like selenium metabolism protein YedF [bacterium]|nr:sulfurtransferase-like selenium metabolism protein YedF [bacterium]MBU1983806.1 sulfurtransferase-like selenium metabolism protein YedF [bacterium]